MKVTRSEWKEFVVSLVQSLDFLAQSSGFWNGEIAQSWQLKCAQFHDGCMERNLSLLAIDGLVEARHLLFVAKRKAALACDRSKDKGVIAHADDTLGSRDKPDLFGWAQVLGDIAVECSRVEAEVFSRVWVWKSLRKQNNATLLAEALDDVFDELANGFTSGLVSELAVPSPELIGDEDAVAPRPLWGSLLCCCEQ